MNTPKNDTMTETKETVMDDKYDKLKNYDFRYNKVFQEGWSKIKTVVSTEMLFESFIKAQVFFYSREVEPVSLEEYMTWLKEKKIDTDEYLENYLPKTESENSMPKTKSENSMPKIESENSVPKTESENSMPKTKSENSMPKTESENSMPKTESENYMPKTESGILVENSKDKERTSGYDNIRTTKHPETFAELIEMIQNGMKLPDAEGPEIEATNDDPTPPTQERKRKPWEVT